MLIKYPCRKWQSLWGIFKLHTPFQSSQGFACHIFVGSNYWDKIKLWYLPHTHTQPPTHPLTHTYKPLYPLIYLPCFGPYRSTFYAQTPSPFLPLPLCCLLFLRTSTSLCKNSFAWKLSKVCEICMLIEKFHQRELPAFHIIFVAHTFQSQYDE